MNERWLEIIYHNGANETFKNPTKVSFANSFLTFRTEDDIVISINLDYIVKTGMKGI